MRLAIVFVLEAGLMVVIKLYLTAMFGVLSLMLNLFGLQDCEQKTGPKMLLVGTADICGAPG